MQLDNLSGFPTIANVPHTAELTTEIELNVFGHAPRDPLCIALTVDDEYTSTVSDAEVQYTTSEMRGSRVCLLTLNIAA